MERSGSKLDGHFLHSQMLINVLLRMKPSERDRQDLIDLLKEEFKFNSATSKLVDEFGRNRKPEKSIWWYTRAPFVYQVLNRALRVQNVHVIFLFRILIRDIFEQLCIYQCRNSITAYRGQMMSQRELNEWCHWKGKLISMNSFLSTSQKLDIVLEKFLNNNKSTESNDLVPVLFEINANPQVLCSSTDKNRPFAHVAHLSEYREEAEVLFMVGSIFLLNKISHNQQVGNMRVTKITLTLCSDEGTIHKRLHDHMADEHQRREADFLSLGDVLRKMGKLDLAERYYNRSLKELPLHDPLRARLYHQLGIIAGAKCETETSLEWYRKSLWIKMQTPGYGYVSIGNTYNSIGNVYLKVGDYDQALDLFNQAVLLFKQANDEDHLKMATFYNNIGIVYDNKHQYSLALSFYQKSFDIRRIHFPDGSADLAGSYNNIGSVYYSLGNYDLSLKHYHKSLAMKKDFLPGEHSSIASTYVNIGLVYEDEKQLEQSLKYLNKGLNIYTTCFEPNHPYVVQTAEHVRRVSDTLCGQK